MSIMLFSFLSFVSADPTWTKNVGDVFDNYIGPVLVGTTKILTPILGPTEEVVIGSTRLQVEEILLAKILLLFLLVSVVWSVVSLTPFFKSKVSKILLTFIVSILGVRLLDAEFIYAILLPYGAFAIAISILVPFVLYAVFVYKAFNSRAARKAAWIVFGVAMLFLGILRRDNLGNVVVWFYPAVALGCGLMIYFDKLIQSWFAGAVISSISEAGKSTELNKITQRIDWANQVIGSEGSSCPPYPSGLGSAPKFIPGAGKTVSAKTVEKAKEFIRNQEKAVKNLLR